MLIGGKQFFNVVDNMLLQICNAYIARSLSCKNFTLVTSSSSRPADRRLDLTFQHFTPSQIVQWSLLFPVRSSFY
jgi:hypothetical protein